MKPEEYEEWLEAEAFRHMFKLWICALNYPCLRTYADKYYKQRIVMAYHFGSSDHQELVQERKELDKAFLVLVRFFEKVGLKDLI